MTKSRIAFTKPSDPVSYGLALVLVVWLQWTPFSPVALAQTDAPQNGQTEEVQEVIPADADQDDTPAEPGAPEPGEDTPAGRSEIIRETTAPVTDATGPATPALTQPPPPPPTTPKAPAAVPRRAQGLPLAIDPAEALANLLAEGIFPAELASRETVTRAEWAAIMIKALGYKTDLVSEFPFYRDVGLDFWAYRPIEIARQEKLIRVEEDGFYHPEHAITYLEAYQAIANAVSGPTPSEESSEMLLAPYPDKEQVPYEAQPVLAKLVNSRFFPVWRRQPPPPLRPGETATPLGLAPLVSHLMDVAQPKSTRRRPAGTTVQTLPAGIRMMVTPTSAIFKSRLDVGQTVVFSLVDAAGPLPRGSRVRGRVVGTAGENSFDVNLLFVRTTEDAMYRMSADFTITFPPEDKTAFIVPGDVFETVSEEVPENGAPGTASGATSNPAGQSVPATVITPSGQELKPDGTPVTPEEQEEPVNQP